MKAAISTRVSTKSGTKHLVKVLLAQSIMKSLCQIGILEEEEACNV